MNGYIITSDGTIWAAGETEEAAWEQFRNIAGLDDADGDVSEFEAIPATKALLAAVEHGGGRIAWKTLRDGTACTPEEAPMFISFSTITQAPMAYAETAEAARNKHMHSQQLPNADYIEVVDCGDNWRKVWDRMIPLHKARRA